MPQLTLKSKQSWGSSSHSPKDRRNVSHGAVISDCKEAAGLVSQPHPHSSSSSSPPSNRLRGNGLVLNARRDFSPTTSKSSFSIADCNTTPTFPSCSPATRLHFLPLSESTLNRDQKATQLPNKHTCPTTLPTLLVYTCLYCLGFVLPIYRPQGQELVFCTMPSIAGTQSNYSQALLHNMLLNVSLPMYQFYCFKQLGRSYIPN